MSCLNIKPDPIFEFLWILYFLCIQLSSLKLSINPWHRRKTHISRYHGCEQLILTNFLVSWSRGESQTPVWEHKPFSFSAGFYSVPREKGMPPGVPWSVLGHTYSFIRNIGINMGKSATFSQQCRQSPWHGWTRIARTTHQLWSVSLFLLFWEPTEDEFKEINDLGLSSLTRKQGISEFPRELGWHL